MGSFNSMPKINNIDSQDDDLKLPLDVNLNELLKHLHANGLEESKNPPTLLQRQFMLATSPLIEEQLCEFFEWRDPAEYVPIVTNEMDKLDINESTAATNYPKTEQIQCQSKYIYTNYFSIFLFYYYYYYFLIIIKFISLERNKTTAKIRLLQWNLLSQCE